MVHVLQQLNLVADLSLLGFANAVHDHLAPSDLDPILLVVALVDLLESPMAQLGVELRSEGVGDNRGLCALPTGLSCAGES